MPRGTPEVTGSCSDWAPPITTDWLLLLLKEASDPVDGGGVNTVAVELLMTDLIKGFCEVHYY